MSSNWPPDVPELGIEKPHKLEKLESMRADVLNAMDPVEAEEHIEDIAYAVAEAYKDQKKNGDFDNCVVVVSTALSVTGNSIGGKFGALMVGESERLAHQACHQYFPSE